MRKFIMLLIPEEVVLIIATGVFVLLVYVAHELKDVSFLILAFSVMFLMAWYVYVTWSWHSDNVNFPLSIAWSRIAIGGSLLITGLYGLVKWRNGHKC